MNQTKALTKSPSPKRSLPSANAGREERGQSAIFVSMVLDMSWRLAVAVLVPVVGGALLDKRLHSSWYVFLGLGVAVIASMAVMWWTMQTANRLPVPKLTAAQKRAIKKSYDEDDD